MDLFDWVDFFMNPFNIMMFGFGAGIITWFISGGFLYTFKVDRKFGIKVMIAVTVLFTLLVWGMFWALIVWYNTPLGPPLELVK